MTTYTPGSEFLVNTQTTGNQIAPTITGLLNGSFVVSWQDASGTLGDTSSSIKAQVFNASGVKIGSEFLVNTQTVGPQQAPSVTGLTNGGFIITWYDDNEAFGDHSLSSAKAQLFDASGTKVGTEFIVNTQATGYQYNPVVTPLANGGFAISWEDLGGSSVDTTGTDIKGQVFDALGIKLGGEIQVNTQTAGSQYNPTITSLAGGGFVVSWWDGSGTLGDASNYSIKAQIFDGSGTKLGGEFLVNTVTEGEQAYPTITGLVGGGFVVSWRDASILGDTSLFSVKAQIFSAAGVKIGSEFLVNTEILGEQGAPSIKALTNGGFVVSWQDASGTLGDANSYSIKAQIFDALGTKIGSEFLVNSQTIGFQYDPTVTPLASGGFAIGWVDTYTLGDGSGYSIKAKVFAPDTVHSSVSYTLEDNVTSLILDGTGNINGTGNSGGNFIKGNDAANILEGLGGDDSLFGGLGRDTASYEHATSPVTVNLSITARQNTGGAGNDLLNSIENLTGSAFGDTLTGSASNNVLNGGEGNDVLEGGAGNDDLLGGNGHDTASYASAAAGVKVDLNLTGRQDTLGAGLDYLNQIENLIGSSHNDVLKGKAGVSVLTGGLGEDQFVFLASNKGIDEVTDFSAAEHDKLVFTGTDYGFDPGDTLVGRELVNGAFSTGVGPQFLFNASNHTLYWDVDGKGGAAAIKVAVLDGVDSLTASDFIFL